jgi:hypothetical protein
MATSREFSAGKYKLEIISSAEYGGLRLITIRDGQGAIAGNPKATWSTSHKVDELTALLPPDHGASGEQIEAIVAFALKPTDA